MKLALAVYFAVLCFASCDNGGLGSNSVGGSWVGSYKGHNYTLQIDSISSIQIANIETDYIGTYNLFLKNDTLFFDAGSNEIHFVKLLENGTLKILPVRPYRKDILLFCLVEFHRNSPHTK